MKANLDLDPIGPFFSGFLSLSSKIRNDRLCKVQGAEKRGYWGLRGVFLFLNLFICYNHLVMRAKRDKWTSLSKANAHFHTDK